MQRVETRLRELKSTIACVLRVNIVVLSGAVSLQYQVGVCRCCLHSPYPSTLILSLVVN